MMSTRDAIIKLLKREGVKPHEIEGFEALPMKNTYRVFLGEGRRIEFSNSEVGKAIQSSVGKPKEHVPYGMPDEWVGEYQKIEPHEWASFDPGKAKPSDYLTDAMSYLQEAKHINNKPAYPKCLVVGYTQEDSFSLVHMLELEHARHVNTYSDMLRYRGLRVYITERGRDRDDFGAIEGLFIQGNHEVIDVME